MILNEDLYNQVWDRIDSELKFWPSPGNEYPPFVIQSPYTIFDISHTAESEYVDDFETNILSAFLEVTVPGERMYALDWQHSGFLFDPRNEADMQNIYVKDDRYMGGGYWAYFPDFYPDGDYYFFIDEQFRFGYLSHPWRKEVWIFGDRLIDAFEKIYEKLGWRKTKEK